MNEPPKIVAPDANADTASADTASADRANLAPVSPPDPYALENLRMDQSFADASTKKLLATVPVGKPARADFVRVHPDSNYRGDSWAMIKDGDDYYLLTQAVAKALPPDEWRLHTAYTAVTRADKVFLWPVPLPNSERGSNDWSRSMAEAALAAQERWVRLKSNKPLGTYDILVAQKDLGDPVWPDYSFDELRKIAFRGDRLIASMDHFLIKKLQGLI